jgi:error-prone DNA polymerase
MSALRDRFLTGAVANGVTENAAAQVFQQLAGFAEFGFCKSHAAAFALVAYQTLYLKAHYPAEYFCGLLNHQPLGFYIPEVLIGDAKRHGVPVLRPDINLSDNPCTLEAVPGDQGASTSPQLAIRLGLQYVSGLGEASVERLLERREEGAYRSLRGFCRRTQLSRPLVENLIRAGAMDCLGQERRDLLWALGGLAYQEQGLEIETPLDPVPLPVLSEQERLGWEYELLGLAPGEQIIQLYRERLREQGVLSKAEMEKREDGETVKVAGWMVIRQRPPTAKGHVFITLEDEEGLINLIIRPRVYERYKKVLRNESLLWAEGRLQRESHAISVLVHRAGTLSKAPRDHAPVPAIQEAGGLTGWEPHPYNSSVAE